MTFFVAADLSAEESTILIFWEFPRMQERVFILYTWYCLATASGGHSPQTSGLTQRSLVWVLWIFFFFFNLSSLLLKAFSSKAWRRKQARENPQDLMAQRIIVPCCLPPASRDSDLPAHISCSVHLFASGSVPTQPSSHIFPSSQSSHPHLFHQLFSACWRGWACYTSFFYYYFFLSLVFLFLIMTHFLGQKSPTWQLFFIPEHPRATCASCLLLATPSLPQLCPKGSSVSVHEGLSGTLEHHLITLYVIMVQPLNYQHQSSYVSLHSQHNTIYCL